MISCLIWPLSIFLHNHIDLRTQNTNLHIMTSTIFTENDCISANIDQFSSKFCCVVAETILHKIITNIYSF